MRTITITEQDMTMIRVALLHEARAVDVHRARATRLADQLQDVDGGVLFSEMPELVEGGKEQIQTGQMDAMLAVARSAEMVVESSESLRKIATLHGRDCAECRQVNAELYGQLTALRGALQRWDDSLDVPVFEDDDLIAEDGEPA